MCMNCTTVSARVVLLLVLNLYGPYRGLLSRGFYLMLRMFIFDTFLYIALLTAGASAVSIYLRAD